VWDEAILSVENVSPTILAVGDSWFWYPFNNLLNPLHRILNIHSENQNIILARGYNGAEAKDYLENPIRKIFESDLSITTGYGRTIRGVFISGGGNDFAGYEDLKNVIRKNCSGAVLPQDCFQQGQPAALFSQVAGYIEKLAAMVRHNLGDGIPIFIHTYDYAIPTGIGFLGLGQWLKAPLDQCDVPQNLQQAVINHLVDAYKSELDFITATAPNLRVVDTRGILSKSDWANELHPTINGFNKIAQGWHDPLRFVGLVR
jgi:hypothetical protein